MKDEITKGNKILIHSKDGTKKQPAKCTGVTHGNLIHFMYTENGCPVAGMVGRSFVEKVDVHG